MNKYCIRLFLLLLISLFSLSSCKGDLDKSIDKAEEVHTTSIEVWTYYGGAQKIAFDNIIDEFNSTIGKEKNIFVKHSSFGHIGDLNSALIASAKGDVGASILPNLFITYKEIGMEVNELHEMVDFYKYYSADEIADYVDEFIDMGKISKKDGDRLIMFPIVRASNLIMLNDTDFSAIKDKIGVDYKDLETFEGIVEVSKKYYEYTDKMTEEPGDGKAFFAIDSLPNYVFLGSKQLGQDFLIKEGSKTIVNFPKENAKRIWDNYYIPMIKGYFAKYGKFTTEDIKVGKVVGGMGSTSGGLYFPDEKFIDDKAFHISLKVMSTPYFRGGEKAFIIQGGGIFIAKSIESENLAAVEFVRWITQSGVNANFAINSCYLPVRKDTFNKEYIEEFVNKYHLDKNVEKVLVGAFNQYHDNIAYSPEVFRGYEDVRTLIWQEFQDFTAKDVLKIKQRLEKGEDYNKVMEEYLSDEYFETWYDYFILKVETILNEDR